MNWKTRIAATLAIMALGVGIAYFMISDHVEKTNRLPIYNPADLNPDLVDESMRDVQKDHTIGDFSFIDQRGSEVTPQTFEGKVYVTDFFFTTCPTICPKMTVQMARVQEALGEQEDFRILSHTVQPEVDSVETLAAYAADYQAKEGFWYLVTGEKKEIYRMARNQYFAATTEGDGGPSDFVHTENFVLVDKEKRIRGFYDGTSIEDVDRLIADVETLFKEYERNN